MLKPLERCTPEYQQQIKSRLPKYSWNAGLDVDPPIIPRGFVFNVAAPRAALVLPVSASAASPVDDFEFYSFEYLGDGQWRDITQYKD